MYFTKYYSSFASVRGNIIRVEIEAPDFYDYDTELAMPPEQPVTLERAAGESELYGLMGTVARLRFIDTEANPIDPADFVVNAFTDLRCSIYLDNVLQFRGYIVLDDVVNEYRVKPIQVELTFSDNVAQLDEIEAPFTIDEAFTNLPEIIARNLALTGLEFDLSIFFSLKPEANTDLGLSLVKAIPRSWMDNVSTYRKAKVMLNDLLTGLRCRLFQLRGEWVMIRTFDYLQNEYAIYPGIKYEYSTLDESATTLDCSLIDTLIPLSFAQTVTYNRARVRVQDTFSLKPLPGIWNADLQELGALVSESTTGDIKTSKYEVPFWSYIGAGLENFYIVVKTDIVLETETDRFLEIPFVNDNSFTGQKGIILNPILVSVGDKFNLTYRIRSDFDTALSAINSAAIILYGNNGIKYRLTYLINTNGLPIYLWNTTTETINTVTTSTIQFAQRGNFVNTEYDEVTVVPATSDKIEVNIRRFPVDGTLYIKLGGYKNNSSSYADLKAEITDLNFEYTFYINDSVRIEAQKHTATLPIDSLNIDEKTIAVDDCIKYSAAGALYDENSANTNLWERAVGDPAKLGEINTTEQLAAEGAGRRVISGIFEGALEFNEFAQFDGSRFIPSRLLTDYQRNQVQGDFVGLMEAEPGYSFKYVYKAVE
jgi:hypothetical protein